MAKQNALRQERRSPAQSISEVAPAKLDRFIHERLRLGILSALAANESAHLHRTEEAPENYRRQSERPRPQTGRRALHHVHKVFPRAAA